MRHIFFLINLLSALLFFSCSREGAKFYTYDGITQGTTFHIVFELDEQKINFTYKDICDSIDFYLQDIDFALSGYNKKSLLSRFNSNSTEFYKELEELILNPQSSEGKRACVRYKIFFENFLIGRELYYITDSILDVSAAPLFDMWGFGFKSGGDVSSNKIDSIKSEIGIGKFTLSAEPLFVSSVCVPRVFKDLNKSFNVDLNDFTADSGAEGSELEVDSIESSGRFNYFRILKSNEGNKLNFNSIAQGYTADYIAQKFNQLSIGNYLIEVGGEIYAKGLNKSGERWRVGIDKPIDGNNSPGENIEQVIQISDQGLVTSGDYRKFYIKDGKKISHTINPKTGYPVEHNLLSATVVADNATISDALATCFMVLGVEQAREFISRKQLEQTLQVVLIYSQNDTLHTSCLP